LSATFLDTLRADLRRRMSKSLPHETWSGPDRMADAAEKVAALLADAAPRPVDLERLVVAIDRLSRSEALRDSDLRLCCAGATTSVSIGEREIRIVDDEELTQRLVAQASQRRISRGAWRRCAFGMTHAVLLPTERPAANADRLTAFVTDFVASAAASDRELLGDVIDVLSEGATRRFWPYILDGDRTSITPVLRLGVPPTSWVWRQILQDAIGEWASWTNRSTLIACVDSLVAAAVEQPLVTDRALGWILNRLATLRGLDEQARLCELVVERWGSPLVPERRQRWQQCCSEAARRMVAGWLTRRVIASFFGVLAGGDADPRRTEFWSRYADRIDELWLYLNERTRLTASAPLRDLRSVLGRSVRPLADDHTNAFAMMIGGCAFVEFSATGNALYVYDHERLPFRLDRSRLTVPELKERDATLDYLTHQGRWEERAREIVGNLTGQWVTLSTGPPR
jgi:hypothetical protein